MIRITHVLQTVIFTIVAQMPLHIARLLMIAALTAACFGGLVVTSGARLVAGPVLDWGLDPDAKDRDVTAVYVAVGTVDTDGSEVIYVSAAPFDSAGATRQTLRGPFWTAGVGEITERRGVEMPSLGSDTRSLDLGWLKSAFDTLERLDPMILLAALFVVCLLQQLALAAVVAAGTAGVAFDMQFFVKIQRDAILLECCSQSLPLELRPRV